MRFFSPNRIIEELKILKYYKKANGVYFQDSTFTANRKFVMELMDNMIKAKLGLLWSCNTRADCVDPELLRMMYEAGGRQIAIGVESGSQKSLEFIKKYISVEEQTQGIKWMREAGFRCINSFIICLPNETEDMVNETIRYAKSLRAPTAVFWLPAPYPGTELFDICSASGGIRADAAWSDYSSLNFNHPVYINPAFGIEKMHQLHTRANTSYYLSIITAWEIIRSFRNIEDLRRISQGILVLLEIMRNSCVSWAKRIHRNMTSRKRPDR